jgi:DAPG hydrolase PhiG domain
MSAELESYLDRAMTPPAAATLEAIEAGPIDTAEALPLEDLDRLLDPTPLKAETGWCALPDGCGYVAVRTEMPGVTGQMLDWWFDWHPREALRYRIWHPRAHLGNSVEPARRPEAKAHWGTVHHPVEDVGTGIVRARIEFVAPSRIGFGGDALADERVATIVCGYAGDDSRHVRHTPMCHVFLEDDGGVVLRSRFWLGAALRPYGRLGGVGEALINRRAVRERTLPRRLPAALARHCAEEYANLASLLGELYGRFGPGG